MSKKTIRPDRQITPLMLSTLSSCRHRYEIEYERGLRRQGAGRYSWPPRLKDLLKELFLARDVAIAEWDHGVDWGRLVSGVKYHWERLHLERKMPHWVDPSEAVKTIKAITDEAEKIFDHYHEIHGQGFAEHRIRRDKKGAIIGRMVTFKPPIPMDRDGSYRVRSRYNLSVRLDKVVNIHGVPWVVIRHLTSNRDREAVLAELKLRIDWRVRAWAATEEIGCGVGGVLFDVIRTKPPSRPSSVKCRKCQGTGGVVTNVAVPVNDEDGKPTGRKLEPRHDECAACAGTGVGGISKQACDTTGTIWKDTLMRYPHLLTEQHAAIHKDTVLRLKERGETFSYRILHKVSKDALVDWMFDTYGALKELDSARCSGRWPRNTGACVGRAGQCPYRSFCAASDQERDSYLFDRISDPYPGEQTPVSAAALALGEYRASQADPSSEDGEKS